MTAGRLPAPAFVVARLAAAALALAFLAAAAPAAHAQPGTRPTGSWVWILDQVNCEPGLRPQPSGPYAALVLCQGSLGTYLVIVRLERLHRAAEGAWNARRLIWQEEPWATDVTSFAWTPDGERLIVATSDAVGAGGLYELDLASRKAKQIVPADRVVSAEKPGPGYILERLDAERGRLHYRALPWNVVDEAAAHDSLALTAGR